MKITYGIIDTNIDVTEICLNKLLNNDIITIPSNDFTRANVFTDPIIGVIKKIFLLIDDILTEYDQKLIIKINIIDKTITTINAIDEINNKLLNIHSKLQIKHGKFNEEVPEQKMSVRYLTGNEKILEIGSNIGRNSLVIGYILSQYNNNNFVTLESDSDICNLLIENKNLNNMNFYIENSALSERNLIQRGWDTIESDILLDGYKNVNIISFEELLNKYKINFDTLILDCEGAFYYILMDMPQILNNINLIIMENDYHNITKKHFIDQKLKENNFSLDYLESGGWGCCYNNFFEVWKKKFN
jgi:FkbM family methyltransferase